MSILNKCITFSLYKSKKLSSAWGDREGVVSSRKNLKKKLNFALERGSGPM
jgi:hypothetical protein